MYHFWTNSVTEGRRHRTANIQSSCDNVKRVVRKTTSKQTKVDNHSVNSLLLERYASQESHKTAKKRPVMAQDNIKEPLKE